MARSKFALCNRNEWDTLTEEAIPEPIGMDMMISMGLILETNRGWRMFDYLGRVWDPLPVGALVHEDVEMSESHHSGGKLS